MARVPKLFARGIRQALETRKRKQPTLTEAFAPKGFTLPQDLREREAAAAGRATARAVSGLASQRGISTQEAGRQLIRVRGQVQARDVALRRARRAGKVGVTLARLRLAGNIPKALLEVRRSQFVTPGGRMETISVPGLVLGRRRIQRPQPGRAPPRATPRRR